MINRDAMLLAGIEFAGGQQMFQHADHWRERLIETVDLLFAEFTGYSGSVGQLVQSVAFLHKPGTKVRCDVAFQPPFALVHHILPL